MLQNSDIMWSFLKVTPSSKILLTGSLKFIAGMLKANLLKSSGCNLLNLLLLIDN